jgi:hypothetical protein
MTVLGAVILHITSTYHHLCHTGRIRRCLLQSQFLTKTFPPMGAANLIGYSVNAFIDVPIEISAT